MSVRKRRSDVAYSNESRRFRFYSGMHGHRVRAFNRAVRREGRTLSRQAMAFAAEEAAEVAADVAEIEAEFEAAEKERGIQTEGRLRLWSIQRTDPGWYNCYFQAVVLAKSEDLARRVYPDGWAKWDKKSRRFVSVHTGYPVHEDGFGSWTDDIGTLEVTLLGVAAEEMKAGTVVCASFHAG